MKAMLIFPLFSNPVNRFYPSYLFCPPPILPFYCPPSHRADPADLVILPCLAFSYSPPPLPLPILFSHLLSLARKLHQYAEVDHYTKKGVPMSKEAVKSEKQTAAKSKMARIQTAEGWKRAMLKEKKAKKKNSTD